MVLSLPRRLRPDFRRGRRLAQFAHAAYETIKDLLQIAADTQRAMPGAVACIQSYGNLLDWRHTGFGAHLSREIPTDPVSRENVARYLANPPIVLDRIVGGPSAGKTLYTGERVIAVIDQEGVIYRILSHLTCCPPGTAHAPRPRASSPLRLPGQCRPRELSHEPVFDLPVRHTQTGDLPRAESA
ncbi:MAG: hypothetical protein HYV46_10485 [candidate division NC10 bacterium]|nr:hypothetical protein [candidate division NC10 bacterium]